MIGHTRILGLGALALCLGGCAESNDEAPLFMLLVDTSGSMERVPGCECRLASCDDCAPDCGAASPDKNRWAHVLEALTGSYTDFECEALERTDDFATYDLHYPVPHYKPMGSQRDDGVLDQLADSVRFGVATFDSVAAYDDDAVQVSVGSFDFAMSGSLDGMWSYPEKDEASSSGRYRYPGAPVEFFMDTGIRSAQAVDGALIVAVDPETATEQAADMQATLLAARPYGSTPIAAALDDLYWLFAKDPALQNERAEEGRKPYVVLISDGRPDYDFRNVNCDCNDPDAGKDCSDYLLPTEDADELRCPYPLPAAIARTLRCGDSEECDEGVVTEVHVIAFDPTVEAQRALDAIASGGGTDEAVVVGDGEDLKAALLHIVESAD